MDNNFITVYRPTYTSYLLTASLNIANCYEQLLQESEDIIMKNIFKVIKNHHIQYEQQLALILPSFFLNRQQSKDVIEYLKINEIWFRAVSPSSNLRNVCSSYELYLLKTIEWLISLTDHDPKLQSLLIDYEQKTKNYTDTIYNLGIEK